MTTRILHEPGVETSGGAPPATPPPTPPAATQPAGTASPVPPAPPAPPVPPARIEIPVDEFKDLHAARTKLAQIEEQTRQALAAKEAEKLAALAAKGEGEKALAILRDAKDAEIRAAADRATALEREILDDHLARVVGDALMKATYVDSHAAPQVRKLFEGQFECVRDSAGGKVVRDKTTMRPAAEVIAEQLASPAFGRFVRATNAGGAGGGGSATTPTPPGQPSEFEKLPIDQQIVAILKDGKPSAPNVYAFGRHNFAQPTR